MSKQFEMARFDPIRTDRVEIEDYKFDNNEIGKLNVWIDSSDKGSRFLRQGDINGNKLARFAGAYTKSCYILCEKATGHFFFLDINDTGIWLFNESFCGAERYAVSESDKILQWLIGF